VSGELIVILQEAERRAEKEKRRRLCGGVVRW
jgi:hypothetical protein